LRLVDEANDIVVIIDGAAATDEKAMVALLDLEVEAIRPHAEVRWSPRLRRWRTEEGQLRGATAEKATGPRDGRPPRVFVSYAHDSPEHKALVLAFATLLRHNGVDADLDHWNTGERRDWYTWMIKQVTEADYVISVASPKYRQAADGDAAPGEHRGAQSEAALLRDLLHADRRTWVPKLLPVVLPGSTVEDVPLFLQPHCADRFEVSDLTQAGVKDLVDHVSGQPAHIRPDLGPLPVQPPHTTGPTASARATEPPDQPMSVVQPTRPLAAEREVLIHKLYEVRLLRQPDTRSELIWQVEQQLGSGINVERSPVDRIDLRRFVNRCFDFAYGPRALLDVLHGGEGDSLPFREAAELVVTLAARHGYPGLDGYRHARNGCEPPRTETTTERRGEPGESDATTSKVTSPVGQLGGIHYHAPIHTHGAANFGPGGTAVNYAQGSEGRRDGRQPDR
jgi:hypothetical protein